MSIDLSQFARRDPQAGQSEHMARWVELFYDLAFVAAILILSSAAAHAGPVSAFGWIAFVFGASWWIWFITTVIANRFRMVDALHRLLLLFQMFVIVLMAMEAAASLSGESRFLVVEYGALLLTTALVAFRGSRRSGEDARFARRLAYANVIAALGCFIAAPLPEPWRVVVAFVALAISVVPSMMWVQRMEQFTDDDEQHLIDRMGAFTLIVCGESFIEVAISMSHGTFGSIDAVSLAFEFILVLAVFTSYFEDVPAAGLRPGRVGWWAGCHLVALVCIAGIAISPSKLVDLRISSELSDRETLTLTIPLAVLYLALAGIGACTRRRPVGPIALARMTTALAVAVCGVIAWWAPSVHLAQALPVITALVVVHAVVVVRMLADTRLVPRQIPVVGSSAGSEGS